MPSDPRALLRSRAYLRLLIIAAVLGVPVSRGGLRLPRAGHLSSVVDLHPSSAWTGLQCRTDMVATAPWPWPESSRAGHPVPARHRRRSPGRWLQGRRRPRRPAARRDARRPGHPDPRRGARTRGAADRHRRRPGRAGRAPAKRRRARRGHGAVLGAAGSFAAISTLLGSPIAGRVPADGGVRAGRRRRWASCCCPACSPPASARSSSSAWTPGPGWAPSPWPIPDLPPVRPPTYGEFGWALVIGAGGRRVGAGIRWLALWLQPSSSRGWCCSCRWWAWSSAGLAIAFAEATGKSSSDVLFSGQVAVGPADHEQRQLHRRRPAVAPGRARAWPTACR